MRPEQPLLFEAQPGQLEVARSGATNEGDAGEDSEVRVLLKNALVHQARQRTQLAR